MQALVLNKAYDFTYQERPYPACPPQNVVVKIQAVCVCGSDIHAIKGDQPLFSFPRVIGHEVAGIVAQVGSAVTELQVGDAVCLMPCIPCGHCRACQKGNTNCCASLQLYGVHQDGGLQEYLSTPAQHWLKVPFEAKPEEISMVEPLTIGAHAVAKLGLAPGDQVLVIGAGPIGMSCAVNAQAYGAQVTMADTSPERRAFGSQRFHLDILDPLSYDYKEQLETITCKDLFDAVVDTTAAKSSMDGAWRWVGQGGKIVFVGISKGSLEMDELPFHMKEPTLYVTRNSTKKDYKRVLELWRQGRLDPARFITHVVPFGQAAAALPQWVRPEAGVFKGVVRF